MLILVLYIRRVDGATTDLIPNGEADKYIDNLTPVTSAQLVQYQFGAAIAKTNHLNTVTFQLLGKNTLGNDMGIKSTTITWYDKILFGNHVGDGGLTGGLADPILSDTDTVGFTVDKVSSVVNYIGSTTGASFNWWLIPISMNNITIEVQNRNSALDLAKVGIFGSGKGLIKQANNLVINNGFHNITYHVFRSENASGSIDFQIKI